jgi:hypothetical protein
VIAYLLAWAIDADSDDMFSAALYFIPIWFFAGIAGLVIALSALTRAPRDRRLGLVALGLVPVNILVFFLSLWR